ncbi:unnamed protein product [Cuscuta epithymum]|uniref:Uncharacterized protein n=1 Tax=Cuscuta epithymum TaxID=186058 RepID=A0AAV0F401_9ASTE|nr:unnamed protein product [Cuscuta epithymum]
MKGGKYYNSVGSQVFVRRLRNPNQFSWPELIFYLKIPNEMCSEDPDRKLLNPQSALSPLSSSPPFLVSHSGKIFLSNSSIVGQSHPCIFYKISRKSLPEDVIRVPHLFVYFQFSLYRY